MLSIAARRPTYLLALGLLALAHFPSILALYSDTSANKAPPIVGRYIVLAHAGVSHEKFLEHKNSIKNLVKVANRKVLALRAAANFASFSAQSDEPFFIKHEYNFDGVYGYSGSFDQETISAIAAHTQVIDIIENDKIVNAYHTQSISVQHGATWGIARISHHKSDSSSTNTDYIYPSSAGNNVMAYIIDTGIYTNHSEFEGRAKWGATFSEFDPEDIDNNGHGTHVAGTVGGKLYGVAKKVNLTAVKVLAGDGSGALSDVIKGIEWALNHHLERKKKDARARSVANMSLGGSKSRALDNAVNMAASKNLHFAVAAGNSYEDACLESPAGASGAITTGASNDEDQLACFSNHGKCVTAIAPGQDITSSWNNGPNSKNTISGTSMAAPHVCGALALIQGEHPDRSFDRAEIVEKLVDMTTKGVIKHMPRKNHQDVPICPFSSSELNLPRAKSSNNLQIVGDDDEKTDLTASSEGKTPNKLLYVLEDPDKQDEQARSLNDQWTSYARYVIPTNERGNNPFARRNRIGIY